MHRRQPADDRMILDGHMARQRRHVGHDDVVAQRAIVRDVTVGQDGVVRTDARDFAVAGRAVNGDVFAEGVAVADFRAGDAALPFQILGFQPEAGEREDFVLPAQFVWPSMTTCECSLQPSPSATCSPMTQYGPISQPEPICAWG